MYVVYLAATNPGTNDPHPLPSSNGSGKARSAAIEALNKLPGGFGEAQQSGDDNTLVLRGDAALPHADEVIRAAHQLYRELRGDGRAYGLFLTGYVVDQAGITKILTPAT